MRRVAVSTVLHGEPSTTAADVAVGRSSNVGCRENQSLADIVPSRERNMILCRRTAVRLLAGAPAMILGPKIASSPIRLSPPAASRIKEIIVVCKTHFDIGYSHRVEDVLTFYRTTMIDRALDLIDRSKELPQEEQFTWTCPGWVFDWIVEDWPGPRCKGGSTCCSRTAFQH
jgi:hypothetical protein